MHALAFQPKSVAFLFLDFKQNNRQHNRDFAQFFCSSSISVVIVIFLPFFCGTIIRIFFFRCHCFEWRTCYFVYKIFKMRVKHAKNKQIVIFTLSHIFLRFIILRAHPIHHLITKKNWKIHQRLNVLCNEIPNVSSFSCLIFAFSILLQWSIARFPSVALIFYHNL